MLPCRRPAAALCALLCALIPTAPNLPSAHAASPGPQLPAAIWLGGSPSGGGRGLGLPAPLGGMRSQVGSGQRSDTPLALPASVDLSQYDPAVGNQGAVNSCASWALGYYLRGWYARRDGYDPGGSGQPDGFAPMYLYAQVNGGSDSGSTLAGNLGVEQQQGIDSRADYTQGDYDWRTQPTTAERANAASYKIASYDFSDNYPSETLQQWIETSLAGGNPVVIALPVYDNFYNADATHYYIDGAPGYDHGGHAVFASKYDSAGVWIENQWGTGWGLNGWAELSWAFINTYAWDAASEVPITPSLQRTATATGTPPTATPTVATTVTATATSPVSPTATITATTTVTATTTAVSPTATLTASATPQPPTATSTPLPPTATPSKTPLPTNTPPAPTATFTASPVPPTATRPAPPTATARGGTIVAASPTAAAPTYMAPTADTTAVATPRATRRHTLPTRRSRHGHSPNPHARHGRAPNPHARHGRVPAPHTAHGHSRVAPTAHGHSRVAPTAHGRSQTSHTAHGRSQTSHTAHGRSHAHTLHPHVTGAYTPRGPMSAPGVSRSPTASERIVHGHGHRHSAPGPAGLSRRSAPPRSPGGPARGHRKAVPARSASGHGKSGWPRVRSKA